MICPAAKTMVKAAMPPGHAAAGRLWRTSAVVDATTERKTPPNSAPEANTTSGAALSTGINVATASRPLNRASGPPLRWRCSSPAHSHDDAITPAPSRT
jgi:hypothetical protein